MTQEALHFIGGEFVGSAGGRLFDNRSPVDNRLVSRVHEAGRAEVVMPDCLVPPKGVRSSRSNQEAAKAACTRWSSTPSCATSA